GQKLYLRLQPFGLSQITLRELIMRASEPVIHLDGIPELDDRFRVTSLLKVIHAALKIPLFLSVPIPMATAAEEKREEQRRQESGCSRQLQESNGYLRSRSHGPPGS